MTRPVDHVDIADGVAVAPEQRRQEAMQGIEIGQREECIAPKYFEPAAAVARTVAQDRAAHAIGDVRLHFLPNAGASSDSLAGDEPDLRPALFERMQQRRDK